MADISTFPKQNADNIRIIKENINMGEIKNYLNEYNLNIVSYIPFLLNTDIISVVNLDSNVNLSYENIVNNNGIIEEINPHNEEDLIYDINGRLTFPKTSTDKDFYYEANFTTSPIEIKEDGVEDSETFYYINDNQHYNFMFYFSTDKISNRNIALLNSSELVYINRGYLCVSITLISPDYLRSYNVTLNSLTTLKAGKEYHIAVIRDIYGGKYRYNLFINGTKHDSQEMIEEDADDLKIGDASSEFNYDNPIKTQFWFHEDPGIKTTIDELYLFDTDSSIRFDSISISTKHNILPFPFELTRNFKTEYRTIKTLNDLKFHTEKHSVYIIKLNSHTNVMAYFDNLKYHTKKNIVNNEKTSAILRKNVNKSVSLMLNTNRYKIKVFKFDTSVQLKVEVKFATLLQNINICTYPLTRSINKNFDKDKKFKHRLLRKVNTKDDIFEFYTSRYISGKVINNSSTIRIPAKKLRTILDELEDIKNGIISTKERDLNPHITRRTVGNTSINNISLTRNINNMITCKSSLKKYIKSKVIVKSDTRRKLGGLEEFIYSTLRTINRNDIIRYNTIRFPSIPVKVRQKLFVDVIKTVSPENNLLKPINIYRFIKKNINIKYDSVKITTNDVPIIKFKTKRDIKGVIKSRASTCRNVVNLSHPFVFIFNTEYFS